VIPRSFRVVPFSEEHNRAAFSCGNEALDRYLREQAGQDTRRHLSTVFVLFDTENNLVAGYYTLSACQLDPKSLPVQLARRLPRRPIPATLIGRFAVDLQHRGLGLGRSLLADALLRAAKVSQEVASMAVIVDAKDEAARAFYEHHGFRRFADDPYRLYLSIAEAERAATIQD
jgi:GNAT superfamily N-acetyltransferase